MRDDEGGPDTDERVIGAAFVAILQRMVAEGPVLVAIDDVHWLDTASRAVLGYAAPRLSGRIALLLASRPAEDVAHDALAWMRLGDPRPPRGSACAAWSGSDPCPDLPSDSAQTCPDPLW